jgi:hypothetical protein
MQGVGGSQTMNEQQEAALCTLLEKYAPQEGRNSTAIPWLHAFRYTRPTKTVLSLYSPSIYLVAQGAKQLLLNDELYSYAAGDYLALSVDLPITSQVTRASPECPFLCFQLDIDALIINDVALHQGNLCHAGADSARGVAVGKAESVLVDSLVRLGSLLEKPDDIGFLAPLVTKEFYYHLLKTPQGAQIARVAIAGSSMQRIASVVAF